jgi:two-component system sensor kinase FixL
MADSPRRELWVATMGINDTGVEVTVADTGPGIPDELAARLFKPFVTTKPGGMGIGLAISRSIIEAHGGRLSMAPNAGGGTVFQFTLPAAQRME